MTDYKKDDNINVYHKDEKKKSGVAGWVIGGVALLALGVAAIYLTDIDLTQTAELPEVSVEGGQMPAIDMDVADVNMGTKTVTVEVPTIDVDLPQEGPEADDLGDNIDVDVDVDADVSMEPERN